MPELMIDLEITEYVDAIIPDLKKSAGPGPVKKAVKCLLNQDPDQVMQWYLDDELWPWMTEKVESFKRPEEDPAEITLTTIKEYISTRYQRYLDYAKYHTSLANLSEQAGDVLHEVIISVLLKDESKLFELYSKKKKSQGLRELDFYILRMIKLNCHSLTSPYRYKMRQPATDGNYTVDTLDNKDYSEDESFIASFAFEEQHDEPEEDPADLLTLRFQLLRDILSGPEFTETERQIFMFKFFLEAPWGEWKGPQNKDTVSKIFRDVQNRIISLVDKRREQHRLKVIDQTFSAAKYMDLRISKAEFLLLRQIVSDNQAGEQDASEVSARLEKKLFVKLEQMIENFNIQNQF